MTSFEDTADVEMDGGGRRLRGRGGDTLAADSREQYRGKGGVFETVSGGTETDDNLAAKSKEGFVIFVRNVHPEAPEEDLQDMFLEFGEVRNFRMEMDRRTCFVKGYALIEYANKQEARQAIEQMDGAEFMERKLSVDWAFLKAAPGSSGRRR